MFYSILIGWPCTNAPTSSPSLHIPDTMLLLPLKNPYVLRPLCCCTCCSYSLGICFPQTALETFSRSFFDSSFVKPSVNSFLKTAHLILIILCSCPGSTRQTPLCFSSPSCTWKFPEDRNFVLSKAQVPGAEPSLCQHLLLKITPSRRKSKFKGHEIWITLTCLRRNVAKIEWGWGGGVGSRQDPRSRR